MIKLRIERAPLLKSLGHVQNVVERRNTIPILSNVLIDATGGKLQLTATDLDLAIVEAVDADIEQEGGTTTPAQTLYDIVRKLPEGAQIELSGEEDGRLLLRAGRSQFHLPCLDREDFPIMTDGGLPHGFTIEAQGLRRLINKTRFAASTEDTRYYLNGVYVHVPDTDGTAMMRAVATDGHRLARVEAPLPQGAAGMPGVIVPRKLVHEVHRLTEGIEGDVAITLSDNKIRIEFDGAVLTSKLIDGTFPDYQRVIPEGNEKIMEVDAKALSDAIDRVSTVSTEKSRAVKMSLEKDKAVLSATSAENASATEELAVSYGSEPLEVGFNARYLIEILAEVEGDSAEFAFSDATTAAIVRDRADADALYLLMPMRV